LMEGKKSKRRIWPIKLYVLLQRLSAWGVDISLYHRILDEGRNLPPPKLKGLPGEYSFGLLRAENMSEVASIRPEKEKGEASLPERLKKGSVCFGARHRGRLVGFTWVNPNVRAIDDRFVLDEESAYHFDMYILPDYRGRNIAYRLRAEAFAYFRPRGIQRFYGVIEVFNIPSYKFMKSQGARFECVVLTLGLFRRLRRQWIVRDYRDRCS